MKSIQEIKCEVLRLKDKNRQLIDTEILELVVGLRAFDIPTQHSCEGHDKKNWTYPYVDIYADDSHISFDDYSEEMIEIKKKWIKENVTIQNKLIALLEEFYKTHNVQYKHQITPHTMIDLAMIRLKCIGSDLLQNMQPEILKKELSKYKKEMKAFGDFLIKKYQNQTTPPES